MGRFSLAGMFLVVAIAAVGLASIRSVVSRVDGGASNMLLVPLVAGAVGGCLFGMGFAVWNRSGIARAIGAAVGGCCLGAVAGAQTSVRVGWPVVFMGPIVLVAMAVLMAANRRRRSARIVEFLQEAGCAPGGSKSE